MTDAPRPADHRPADHLDDDAPDRDAPYRDPGRPVAERVADLLARMTLEEKVGQLNAPLPMPAFLVSFLEEEPTAMTVPAGMPVTVEQCEAAVRGRFHDGVGPVGGFFALTGASPDLDPAGQAELHARLQRIARDETRLGIPLLQLTDGLYGLPASGATVFPEGPTLGSTWDPGLVEEVFAAVAREARATGVHLATVVTEPIRDPRLGRSAETFTEDPHLTARYARAIVAGGEGDDIAAADRVAVALTHFPGQNQPVSGMERGAMDIGERTLREVFHPVWASTLGPQAPAAVMATYVSIDGETVHGSERYLTGMLREELGFGGVVLSEGLGLETLQYEGVVETQAEAGRLALRAGVDLSITFEDGFLTPLRDGVRDGLVAPEDLDRAVRRVLALKFRLGLFDQPVDTPADTSAVHGDAHRELALTAARDGIVLLRNEGPLLPLPADLRRVAVVGPHASEVRTMLGDRAPAHVPQRVVTLVEALAAKLGPDAQVVTERGCDVLDPDPTGIAAAAEAARSADVAVVAVGERTGEFFSDASVGERYDVTSLDLTGAQQQLVEAVHATGTPVVVVLVNGRALSTRWIAEHVPAVVEAWLPGERGAEAIADVLVGDAEPGGRLPVTVPATVGQLPLTYDHKPSRAYWTAAGGYVDSPAGPLYPFGHGLSFTTFAYRDLRVDSRDPASGPLAEVAVTVANTGDRAGSEVVQLYVRDRYSSVATPVTSLRGVAKLRLAPGETEQATFLLWPADLALFDAAGRYVVEAGVFDVMVGSSSAEIHLTDELTVDTPLDLGSPTDPSTPADPSAPTDPSTARRTTEET